METERTRGHHQSSTRYGGNGKDHFEVSGLIGLKGNASQTCPGHKDTDIYSPGVHHNLFVPNRCAQQVWPGVGLGVNRCPRGEITTAAVWDVRTPDKLMPPEIAIPDLCTNCSQVLWVYTNMCVCVG